MYARDFPDPFVLPVDDTYYGYSTNVGVFQVPVIKSTDLITWERAGDAMPALPDWARIGFTWAPGVIHIDDTFVLYFTARHAESGRQCIGVAVADSPEGQFRSESDEPFICQLDLGGSIDPYPFRDEDGTLYLYWKNDGNCCALRVWLWGQELSDDGLTLVGEPTALLQRDQLWERPLIENPAMVEHEDRYYLFYSGNRWDSVDYAVGYGVCETAMGPCEKPLEEPILTFVRDAMGPGGQALFYDEEGNLWMAYHAWTGMRVGYPRGERSLHLDVVEFEDGQPVIEGPTTDPQPLP
ncbi:MAG: glycoside hydrolase family 43 protein [Chloroflexota bacterium]|nr:glycoside hydrolase family 43 protein [Chloroflexota bacterium]